MTTIYNYQNLKKEFPREVVKKLLLEDGHTYRELQTLYQYNERLWSKLAKEYNIQKQFNNIRKNANKYHNVNIDSNILIDLYTNKHYSLRNLATYFNCNRFVIKNKLKELNIEIRPFNDKNYYINRVNSNKGKCFTDSSGYTIQSSKRQHRTVMENYLGRPLTSDEHIHHIDFNKANNAIENLFLFDNNKIHLSYHGYLKNHNYIHPKDFVEIIYPKIKEYKSQDFLYQQYISLGKSIAQISKDIDCLISRNTISKLLKKYNLFNTEKHINQYI